MASVMKLPILFVAENNLYSSHLDISLRQPADSVARFAEAAGVASKVVDGNDVVAVAAASAELVERSRNGGGPGFLEAVPFRWRGHVGPNEDIDVGVRRSPEELAAWKGRDPLRRLLESLEGERSLERSDFEHMAAEVREEIRRAVRAAREAPYPQESALLDLVYAEAEQAA
jgi:pyruvate dehydrogenase E1 component alpha subunit